MHKVNSPVQMEPVVYKVNTSGIADVWLRKNQTELPEMEEGPGGFEADEIYFKTGNASKEEILADFDFWWEHLSNVEEGQLINYLAVDYYRDAKRVEISKACEQSIYNGVDVELSGGSEHFSLTEKDQLNLFGKQAQLATGATRLEYHQDGMPCTYYSAVDMKAIIDTAMYYVSFQTTYCNSLFIWLNACTRASEMAEIAYGCEIPEEHQSTVLKDYINV